MLASLLFLLAALFYLIAGLGLLRLPDSLARLHAGTKASSLATTLALSAAFAHHGTLWSALMCGACLLFVFLTAPLASHAIARCVLASRLTERTTRLEPAPAMPAPVPPPETKPASLTALRRKAPKGNAFRESQVQFCCRLLGSLWGCARPTACFTVAWGIAPGIMARRRTAG